MSERLRFHAWVLVWPDGEIRTNHAGNPYAFGTKHGAETCIYNSNLSTLRAVRFEAAKRQEAKHE